jgi:hypothetical protein
VGAGSLCATDQCFAAWLLLRHDGERKLGTLCDMFVTMNTVIDY